MWERFDTQEFATEIEIFVHLVSHKLYDLHREFVGRNFGNQCVLTESGCFCQIKAYAEVGDKVVLISGMEYPIILRPLDSRYR